VFKKLQEPETFPSTIFPKGALLPWKNFPIMATIPKLNALNALNFSLCLLLVLFAGCQTPEPAEVAGDYQGFFGSPAGKKRLGFAVKIEQTGTTLKGTYRINGTKNHSLEGTVTGKNVTLVLKDVPKQVVSEGQKIDFWDSEEPLILSGSFKSDITENVLFGNLDSGEWTVPWQLKAKVELDP
jgi:hypothetical protein